MPWEVEFTDEFEAWWNMLTGEEQEDVKYSAGLLEELGTALGLSGFLIVRQRREIVNADAEI